MLLISICVWTIVIQLQKTAAHLALEANLLSASFEPNAEETRPQFPRSGAKESFPLSVQTRVAAFSP